MRTEHDPNEDDAPVGFRLGGEADTEASPAAPVDLDPEQRAQLIAYLEDQLEGDTAKQRLLEWLVQRGESQLALAREAGTGLQSKLDRLGALGAGAASLLLAVLGLALPAADSAAVLVPCVLAFLCFAVAARDGFAANLPRPLLDVGDAERWALDVLPWRTAVTIQCELLAELAVARRRQEASNRRWALRCRLTYRWLVAGFWLSFAALAIAALRLLLGD